VTPQSPGWNDASSPYDRIASFSVTTRGSVQATRPTPSVAGPTPVQGVPSRPRRHDNARVLRSRASEGVADLASPLVGHASALHSVHHVLPAPRLSPDG
jgi:hypothetical protein